MNILSRTRSLALISGLLSDKSLTKKAYLNAVASMLEYATSLLVGFFLIPFMVTGLGDYSFGLWQVLNRLVGYLTPASGRPTDALKWTLANQQTSNDFEKKRRYVGSTLIIWAMFLPVLLGLGVAMAWFAPRWINASIEFASTIRLVSMVLVANLIVGALLTVPQGVLQGENIGYKRMGLTVGLILLGGVITWLAIYIKSGIVGVSLAVLIRTILAVLFYLSIVRRFAPWFGIAKPLTQDVREMLGRSWWFLGWSLVMILLLGSDVVVLGIFDSIIAVTNYSLTKYAPEMMITFIANVVFAIVPGLGGIIGSGDVKRAARLRGEMMSMIWLATTVMGTSILLCNRSFIGLWVGVERFAGPLPHLLIVIGIVQFVFIRSDANIIDVTLHLSQKVLLGFLSVTISVVAASLLAGSLKLGIVGLCLGIMAGRLILTVSYPVLISHFLKTSWSSQLRTLLRPMLVTILLFGGAIALENLIATVTWLGVKSWIEFFIFAVLSALTSLVISFYAGLTTDQRSSILHRAHMVFSHSNPIL